MKKSLSPSESFAVVAFIGLILFVALVAHFNKPRIYEVDLEQQARPRYEVAVEIVGHVRKPGRYYVEKGTPLGDVLAQAHPYRDADLRRLKRSQSIQKPRTIRIKQRETITVTVEGAVQNPGVITLYKGARLCDLAEHLTLLEQASTKNLKAKRVLKDGERVVVLCRAAL